ncbi:LysR substrate-binding domain-containing protein [Salipiger mucosus]|uniref:LysR substrate-binding domain-containing protein n=1 Tax=Salipiger mucosus TaxID=263378 RepID=UPI00035F33BA|nr:LysR substrate-binding domain-containing protein [Salipiger mucosus]
MPKQRTTLPPMNALRHFEVAGRHQNFRMASEELGVSQGAVAQQIRLLEDHLGLPLFARLPRGVVLTTRGAAYHAELARAFDILRQARSKVDDSDGHLTVSTTPTFATRLLIPNLASLNSVAPGVEIRTVATVSVTDFDRDQIDIVVRETRPPFPADHEAELLFRQDLIIVGSPHLLGNTREQMTRARARHMPLLHDGSGHWKQYFGTTDPLPGATFNQISLALDAALSGQGLAIVSRAFVQQDLKAGRLVDAGPIGYEPAVDYFLVRKRSAHPRPVSDQIWKWCLDTFAEKK